MNDGNRHLIRKNTHGKRPEQAFLGGITVRAFSLVFLVLLLAVLGILAYENNHPETLTLWQWQWELPFPIVLAGLYVLGMLTGWALLGAVKRSWRRVTEAERA